jgi:D-sedoheptulose 7-phosphate isomerase
MADRIISEAFAEAARLLQASSASSAEKIHAIAGELIACFERGHKALIFGNGGSASQAQHLAAELVNKLSVYRRALPAIALTTDTSLLTSISNDLDFSQVFARQIEALGSTGDVAWALSTSGSSPNVIKAVELARKAGLTTVCFVGHEGSPLARLGDIALSVPSPSTARIQEVHLCAGHAVCELVERHFLQART